MRQLRLTIGDLTTTVDLLDEDAPVTTQALWDALPIATRTIPTQWSGRAWRTESDHALVPYDPDVTAENLADRLSAGDMIFYPRIAKIGLAYGDAKWLGPFMLPRQVSLVGRVRERLDELVTQCMRIIYEGPFAVELSRVE